MGFDPLDPLVVPNQLTVSPNSEKLIAENIFGLRVLMHYSAAAHPIREGQQSVGEQLSVSSCMHMREGDVTKEGTKPEVAHEDGLAWVPQLHSKKLQFAVRRIEFSLLCLQLNLSQDVQSNFISTNIHPSSELLYFYK